MAKKKRTDQNRESPYSGFSDDRIRLAAVLSRDIRIVLVVAMIAWPMQAKEASSIPHAANAAAACRQS